MSSGIGSKGTKYFVHLAEYNFLKTNFIKLTF